MQLFLSNKNYRQLLINSWISSFGDHLFYLAIISYVTQYSFAPLAIFLLTLSETIPLVLQVFLGVVGDFQTRRIQKWWLISFFKIILYGIVTLHLFFSKFSILSVILICIMNFFSDTLSYFSSAMTNAVYIQVIQEDITSAMGFRQSTMRIVQILSNLAGAALISFLNIQLISTLNVLTFLFAFLGLTMIRSSLQTIEDGIELPTQTMTLSHYLQHLKESIQSLVTLKQVVIILLLTISIGTILNASPQLLTLASVAQPFSHFSIAQIIAALSITLSIGSILGSATSGNLFKAVSFFILISLSILSSGILLVGIFYRSLPLILGFSFLISLLLGALSPKLQTLVFEKIPQSKMGTIGAALNFLDVVAPSLITLVIIALASSLGILTAITLLFLLLLSASILGFLFLKK